MQKIWLFCSKSGPEEIFVRTNWFSISEFIFGSKMQCFTQNMLKKEQHPKILDVKRFSESIVVGLPDISEKVTLLASFLNLSHR